MWSEAAVGDVPAGATGALVLAQGTPGWTHISPLVLTVSSLGDMAAAQRTPGRCPFGAQRSVRAARLCDDNCRWIDVIVVRATGLSEGS